MQDFLSKVLGYIKIGFNLESKARMMKAHNVAKSYNMLHALNENNEIDYSRITLTYGKLPGAKEVQHFSDDAGIHLGWWLENFKDNESNHDQVMILAESFADDIAYCIYSGARRKLGQETLQIPQRHKGSKFHTWISFVSGDRTGISMSS